MSKRTDTESALVNPSNYWPTPFSATSRLAEHLAPQTHYVEPCAGNGAIATALGLHGHTCDLAFDLCPQAPGIALMDATQVPLWGQMVITNPPYAWKLLKPLLDCWIGTSETWLLLPWDMTCNKRFSPYAQHIDRMIPLGRVSWLGNGKAGMENSGWFHFGLKRAGLILPRD